MRRTQLYLQEHVWETLHVLSRSEKTTISELVRRAVKEKYLGETAERKEAMQGLVGLWKDRPEMKDPEDYIRKLRKGTRLERLSN